MNCPYAWCSASVLPQCVGHKPSEIKENTRSFSYRGRHDDPGPAKERINARGGATGRAATPPHCGPNPTPWHHFWVSRSPPIDPGFGRRGESTLRIVAQPGQSACSGCKRSPVRIRPVRPIFEPFDLGYCESSRSPTRRPAVRSPLAQPPFEPKLLGYHNKRNVNLLWSAQAGRFPGANSEAGSPKTTRGQILARNPQATPGPFLSS